MNIFFLNTDISDKTDKCIRVNPCNQCSKDSGDERNPCSPCSKESGGRNAKKQRGDSVMRHPFGIVIR